MLNHPTGRAKCPISNNNNNNNRQLPELFLSNAEIAAEVSRQVKVGKLRKLTSRLYTNLKESPERLVLRNLWPLVGEYLPGALIADRTALEGRPAQDGSVFLISDHKRDIALPGVTLRPAWRGR